MDMSLGADIMDARRPASMVMSGIGTADIDIGCGGGVGSGGGDSLDSRGRRCTAPTMGGAFGLPQVGFGRASVSFASSRSRCLMGLGTFLILRGTSKRSIS